MNIILIGFKGCGKTLIGKTLAAKLKREFYDTDSIIESIYTEETKSHLSFREIYKKHGSEYFRNLEKKALERVEGLESSVISLGGGTIFSDFGFRISDFGFVIYLHVEPDILYERIVKNSIPAFFDSSNPRQSFDKLYAERLPLYKRLADIVIDNSGDAEETIKNILLELKNKNLINPREHRGTKKET
ncbi:MAG: shikimate kinase [Nitrospinae bacterium]|nr:shikimate kinase [Nitrospinota bacterium]